MAQSNHKRHKIYRRVSSDQQKRWDLVAKRSEKIMARGIEIRDEARAEGREIEWRDCVKQAEKEIPIEYATD